MLSACTTTPTSDGARGRVVDNSMGGTGGQADASVPPLITTQSGGAIRSGGVSSGTGATMPSDCGRAELTVTRPVPTVWLLVDASGSMGDPLAGLGTASRWQTLRETLLDPSTGLVAQAQGEVAFGLMVYDGNATIPLVYDPALCPRTTTVAPALTNLAAIEARYPALEVGGSTPTNYALQTLSEHILSSPPATDGPTVVVLATDGHPNFCDFHDGIPTSPELQAQSVTVVADLASKDIKTYVISLLQGDATLQMHLDDLARVGDTGQNSAFTPTTKDALVETLTTIVQGAVGCTVRVDGKILPGKECAGQVILNGTQLPCDDENGFRVQDGGQSLELQGAACTTLRSSGSATLTASFPCEAVDLS